MKRPVRLNLIFACVNFVGGCLWGVIAAEVPLADVGTPIFVGLVQTAASGFYWRRWWIEYDRYQSWLERRPKGLDG